MNRINLANLIKCKTKLFMFERNNFFLNLKYLTYPILDGGNCLKIQT